MKHRVTIGKDNRKYGLLRDSYEPNEHIRFFIMTGTDISYDVRSAETKIKPEEGAPGGKCWYSFEMPDCDVTVVIKETRGMDTILTGPEFKEPVKTGGCPECGAKLYGDPAYCPECGRKLR